MRGRPSLSPLTLLLSLALLDCLAPFRLPVRAARRNRFDVGNPPCSMRPPSSQPGRHMEGIPSARVSLPPIPWPYSQAAALAKGCAISAKCKCAPRSCSCSCSRRRPRRPGTTGGGNSLLELRNPSLSFKCCQPQEAKSRYSSSRRLAHGDNCGHNHLTLITLSR